MKKKILFATTMMLVITFALIANTAIGIRIDPRLKVSREKLTEITSFDQGVSGWKLFSLPFDASVSMDEIRVTYDGEVMTLNQASNANIICRHIYVYDNEMNNWKFSSKFESGNGYMVYVYVNDEVTLSAVGIYNDCDEPIPLGIGWNYFGIPLSSTIPISGLRFSCTKMRLKNLNINQAHGILIDKNMFHATNTNNPFYKLVNLDSDLIIPGNVYLLVGLVDGVEMSYVSTFR